MRNGDGYADLEQKYAYYAPNTQNLGGGPLAPPQGLRNRAHLVRNMRNFALKVRSGDAMTHCAVKHEKGRLRRVKHVTQ